MIRRWIDGEGHAWPITGHYCCVCGMPLHRLLVEHGHDAHHLCITTTKETP